MTITLRITKGSSLTYEEMDENIRDLYEDTTIDRVLANANLAFNGIITITGILVNSNNDPFILNSFLSANYVSNVNFQTTLANTNFYISSVTQVANQETQEAATSNSYLVTSGRQHHHPSALKGWVKFNSAGTVLASYNVASVANLNNAFFTINWDVNHSSNNYWVGHSLFLDAGTYGRDLFIRAQTVGTTQVQICDATGGNLSNVDSIFVSTAGDQ